MKSYGVSNQGYQADAVRYTTPSRLNQLQGQVDEVTDVMKSNIKLELERGGKLDELEFKSDMLNEGARQFSLHSTKLKKKYWWKSCKMSIILAIVVIVIIVAIILGAVLGSKKKGS